MQFCLATLMRIFPLLLPSSALVCVSAHSRAQSEVRELRICLSRNRNSINHHNLSPICRLTRNHHHNLSPDTQPPSQFVARYATTITICRPIKNHHHNLSPDKEPPSQFVARYATTITMCTLHTLCCEVLMSSAHSTSEVLLLFLFMFILVISPPCQLPVTSFFPGPSSQSRKVRWRAKMLS